MATTLELAYRSRDLLGEGPWWSVRDQMLWRVDILSHLLHSWTPDSGESARWELGDDVGFAVPVDGNTVVVGLRQGIAQVDLDTGEQVKVVSTPGVGAGRFNDGKTDKRGRVWAGTIVDDQSVPDGAFGHLDKDGFHVHLGGMGISNGLGWSPNNETMYVTDSAIRTIWEFDFDVETGTLENRRVFAVDDDCEPDGLTVDAEGGVWSAKWNGSRVVRYDANGAISETVDAPVSRPTSCMFGGPDLGTLYVTSASVGLDDAERSSTPAGSVLAVRPGVRGLPEVEAVVNELPSQPGSTK